MGNAKVWFGGAMMFATALGASQPAAATTVSLWSTGGVGGSLTVNGLTVTVASCAVTLAGVLQSNCNNTHLSLVSSGLGPIAQLDILGDGTNALTGGINGSDGLSILSAAMGRGIYDLTFALNISTVLPQKVTNANMTLSGSAVGTESFSGLKSKLPRITASEVFGGAIAPTITDILTTVSSSSTAGTIRTVNSTATGSSTLGSPSSSFSVTNDLKLDTTGRGNGDILILRHLTQVYTTAPEPLSIGAFLVGLGGLLASRRRKNS